MLVFCVVLASKGFWWRLILFVARHLIGASERVIDFLNISLFAAVHMIRARDSDGNDAVMDCAGTLNRWFNFVMLRHTFRGRRTIMSLASICQFSLFIYFCTVSRRSPFILIARHGLIRGHHFYRNTSINYSEKIEDFFFRIWQFDAKIFTLVEILKFDCCHVAIINVFENFILDKEKLRWNSYANIFR